MGKRIRVQRRGRGSSTFRALTHKRVAPTRYISLAETKNEESPTAMIEDLVHEPGRGAPIAKIRYKNGVFYNVAPEGVFIGQEIQLDKASTGLGNILPLGQVPPGTLVCSIELSPGDGGKLVKSSGTYATVVAHTSEGTLIKLPSGKSKYFNDSSRATIGVVAGAGRTDRPFLTAGKRLAWVRSKGRTYPTTKGIAMNPAFHPHGGGSHTSQSMRPTTVSRMAPPGQKVGLIAARQTGRKKRRAELAL